MLLQMKNDRRDASSQIGHANTPVRRRRCQGRARSGTGTAALTSTNASAFSIPASNDAPPARSLSIEAHQAVELAVGDRPAICAAGDRRQDGPRARRSGVCRQLGAGPAREDPPAARASRPAR